MKPTEHVKIHSEIWPSMTNPSLLRSKDPCIQFPHLIILRRTDRAGLPCTLPTLEMPCEHTERHFMILRAFNFKDTKESWCFLISAEDLLLDLYLNVPLACSSHSWHFPVVVNAAGSKSTITDLTIMSSWLNIWDMTINCVRSCHKRCFQKQGAKSKASQWFMALVTAFN